MEKAWQIIADRSNSSTLAESIFSQFGDTITFKEKFEGKAEAFKMATNILRKLSDGVVEINKYEALKKLFSNLINQKLPDDLIEDICNEAKFLFEKKENILIETYLHVINYRKSKNETLYLKTINPDMAIAVSAINNEIDKNLISSINDYPIMLN